MYMVSLQREYMDRIGLDRTEQDIEIEIEIDIEIDIEKGMFRSINKHLLYGS